MKMSSMAVEFARPSVALLLFACAFGEVQLCGMGPGFSAAWVHRGHESLLLTVFPMVGQKKTVTLPHVPLNVTVSAFAADGIYLQPATLEPSGIIKVEFQPLRTSVVPGAAEFRTIWNLRALPSGMILIAGLSGKFGECGTFEIDPTAGTSRPLLVGRFPDCGGGGGTISPDGRRVVSYNREDLSIVDLTDNTIQAIKGIPGRSTLTGPGWPHSAAWSPDGKWISVVLEGGDLFLVDTTDTSKRKRLGRSDGPSVWSPDAEQLLLPKSELRCKPSLYFESLQSVDVATGTRTAIPSSHCEVGAGWYGWVDSKVVE